jgi:hypothetical protein
MIQKIIPGKWEALFEITARYNELESRLGYPPSKHYRCITGTHDLNTIIVERQWDSMAAMEAAYEKAFVEPAYQTLNDELNDVVASTQIELYMPMP